MVWAGLYVSLLHIQEIVSPASLVAAVTIGETTQRTFTEQVVVDSEAQPSSIFFTGDIMLGRHVETLMREFGPDYVYRGTLPWQNQVAYVVGNFEASIPQTHQKTPNFNVRFSVSQQYTPALQEAGFTHLSLANNHSYDFGLAGYQHTVDVLSNSLIQPFGHPLRTATSSVTYLKTASGTVAVLALHALPRSFSVAEAEIVLREAARQSDWQVVYIHWGDEYVSLPNNAQRRVATALVESGADLIVGHHPHVVQAVEYISDVPIFYSVGNFIFDQYFSPEVQQGLVLELAFSSGEQPVVRLWPVSSLARAAQPAMVGGMAKSTFLRDLATISGESTQQSILSGFIALTAPDLATSTEMAIMNQ